MARKPRPLSPLAAAIALLAAACGGEDPYQGVDTPASQGNENGELDPATCPDDAPVLGTAGSSQLQTFALNWSSDGLDAFMSDYQYFVVPDDVRSLLVSVEQGRRTTSINQLFLNGEALIDLTEEVYAFPFFHEPIEIATITLPINGDTYPGGGCLAIDPVAFDTTEADTGSLHIVTRRDAAQATEFHVNLIVVGDTSISDDDLSAALGRMNTIYRDAGAPEIGVSEVWDLDYPEIYLDAEGSDVFEVRSQPIGDDPFRMNIFFIQDFTEVGTLGFAAGIPGPNGVPGTGASGRAHLRRHPPRRGRSHAADRHDGRDHGTRGRAPDRPLSHLRSRGRKRPDRRHAGVHDGTGPGRRW